MPLSVAILGAGFIGGNLLRSCLERKYYVKVLDRNQCPAGLADTVEWIQGSFADPEDVARTVGGTDVIFHLISNTVPGDPVDESEELFSNVFPTINLLKICVKEKVKRIVFISSSSVYGVRARLPVLESDPTDPISSHGIHKLTIEKYLQLYNHAYDMECKIMRLSNPYGPGQSLYGRQGYIAMVVGWMKAGRPVLIRGDGTSIRDYLYIDDVVQASHLLALTDSKEVIFNIGSGLGVSVNQMLSEIEVITGVKLRVKHVGVRKTDIPSSILNISKARSILGYSPSLSLKEGLSRMLAFNGIINGDDSRTRAD